MMDVFRYDFDYTWPWTFGHLIVTAVFALLTVLVWRAGWPRWAAAATSALAVWALTGAFVVHGPMRFNRPMDLPTERFLASGSGRVLDAGAGSGRSALMVLLERPEATVVALDLFLEGYGIGENTPDRLRANARVAGVESRLEIQTGDLREMPLASGSVDAAVSAYAIDHLDGEGIRRSLAEVSRVLRPGGEFLLMVIHPDGWTRLAFPLFGAHGYFGGRGAAERWRAALVEAGFEVLEEGTAPATLYLLVRSRGHGAS
jgi:SAM-dependent methyltransferase